MSVCCASTVTLGRIAADEILKNYFLIDVRKALDPLNPHDFVQIVKSLAAKLAGHAMPIEHDAIKKAVDALDVDWHNLPKEARWKLIDQVRERYLEPMSAAMMPAINQSLSFYAKDIVTNTKSKAIKKFDLNISSNLNAFDSRVLHYCESSQGNYVTDRNGKRNAAFGWHARTIVSEGLDRGLGSSEIAGQLHAKLGPHADARQGRGYWDMLAMVFANRARTMTQLGSFHESGIADFLFESILDEVTSVQCRFLHGRRFPVARAMEHFDQVESLEDPQDINVTTPFINFGTVDGKPSLYVGRKGADAPVTTIAEVTHNAVGTKDHTGSYANAKTNEQLLALGISTPPLHGRCRSTIIPEMSEMEHPSATVAAPAAPAAVKPPKTEDEKTDAAVAALHANPTFDHEIGSVDADSIGLKNGNAWKIADEVKEAFGKPFDSVADEAFSTSAFSSNQKFKLSDLQVGHAVLDSAKIEAYLKDPKSLAHAEYDAVTWKGQNVLTKGNEALAAHKLLGKKVLPNKVVVADLDKYLLEKPAATVTAPHLPVLPPQPQPATSKPPISADVIMHEKTGAAKGSNDGGFYTGKDGVARYVKFYSDPSQAAGEHLANTLYKDLGIGAPDSHVFEYGGKQAYASDILKNGKTLQDAGLTAARARSFLKGFVGDVLTGNWDAVGMNLDNAMVVGEDVYRIDNGGTFLMRAKAGRKGAHVLNDITEWDKFFDPTVNPAYTKVVKAAGYLSPEDFKDDVVAQIKKVIAVRDANGGWQKYVDQIAPQLNSVDRSAIVSMLNSRSEKLSGQLADMTRVRPPPRVREPGEKVLFGMQSPEGAKVFGKLAQLQFGHDRAEFYRDVYAKAGINNEDRSSIASTIGEWTGEFRHGTEHAKVYKAANNILDGKGSAQSTIAKTLKRTHTKRSDQWRAALDQMGLADVPTPTHFDATRGIKGEDWVLSVARAWADDSKADVKVNTDPVASWGFREKTGRKFAGVELNGTLPRAGVMYRWHIPIESTLMDQVVDDASFLTTFHDEHEIIAGEGKDYVTLPKESHVVFFDHKEYTYADRKELIEALRRNGHTL